MLRTFSAAFVYVVLTSQAFGFSLGDVTQLPEARLHDSIHDRQRELPDSYEAVAGERKIALYVGRGVFGTGRRHFKRMLRKYGRSYQTVTAQQIIGGILDSGEFSTLIMPGGKSWHYLADLGDAGAEQIRRFVASGGGYMGVCAGAYYATSMRLGPDQTGPYGIGLLDGVAYDGTSMHTYPFREGMMFFNFSVPGFKRVYKILMLGGPSFRFTHEEATKKNIRVLAEFQWIHEPAIISLDYGKGRVMLSGPHGEVEERRAFLGIIYHDRDSEWPFFNRMLTYLGGGQ